MDQSPEGAGLGETLEVSAGLAEALTETLDVADEEVAPDKTTLNITGKCATSDTSKNTSPSEGSKQPDRVFAHP